MMLSSQVLPHGFFTLSVQSAGAGACLGSVTGCWCGFPFIGAALLYIANFPGGAAWDLHLGLVFVVGLSTCGCWYVNGTYF